MRRFARGILLGIVAAILALAWLALITARPGNARLWPPEQGTSSTEIFLVSNGYHTGLVVPTAQLAGMARRNGAGALASVADRFSPYPFIEIGWGEEQFYSAVPTVAQMNFSLAVRALFWPGNSSVLHLVGISEDPRKVFRSADVVRIGVSEPGFTDMLKAMEATFARNGTPPAPQVLGPGLYGPSLFYRAQRSFHLFNVCNHWVADMLSAAGLPVTPVLDTLPRGMLLDLKWRAGLDRLPEVQP